MYVLTSFVFPLILRTSFYQSIVNLNFPLLFNLSSFSQLLFLRQKQDQQSIPFL